MHDFNIPEWVLLGCTSISGLLALIGYIVLRSVKLYHPKNRLQKAHPDRRHEYDL